MSLSISELLPDFSEATGSPTAPAMRPPREDAVRKAYSRGEAAGRQAAENAAAADSAMERARWTTEQAEALADAWSSALDHLETRIGDQIASVLTPFLGDQLRARALDALARKIVALVKDATAQPITLTGPPDLLERLSEALRQVGIDIEGKPDRKKTEIAVTIGATRLETTLAVWMSALEGSDDDRAG